MMRVAVFAAALLLLAASLAAASPNGEAYLGHQVWSLRVDSEHQAHAIEAVLAAADQRAWGLHLWSDSRRAPGAWDVQVPSAVVPQLSAALAALGVETTVLHEDLGLAIDELMRANADTQAREGASFFDAYATAEQMDAFLVQMSETYSDVSQLVDVGTTVEGRSITGLRVCTTGDCSGKPAVVFAGCQHAREWLSPMTLAYVMDGLLGAYSSDSEVQLVMDAFEWTFIPIVNVDGYVYSWTVDRLWRKNRRQNADSTCYGVDTNRNWDWAWSGAGASGFPCSDTYYGSAAFSEPEDASVAQLIQENGRVQWFIDFHMYGSFYIYPWAYECSTTRYLEYQQGMATAYTKAVKDVNGLQFTTGPTCEVLYEASGGSDDWALGATDAVYSYTLELRGNTFLLPASNIIPSGEEQLAGVLAGAQYVMANPMPPNPLSPRM